MFAAETTSLIEQMGKLSVEELLLPLLIQLVLIIAAARVFAALARRIGQPAVVGEIAAGVLLGPSVLGRAWPQLFEAVFHPAVGGLPAEATDLLLNRVLMALAQVGLILLLFLVGLEFDFAHLRSRGRAALGISLTGIALPFGLGVALGWAMHPLVAAGIPRAAFVLFMGTAMSITAMPVLGRMMSELRITRTRVAAVTIAAAAADDAAGWILLATVAALAAAATGEGTFDPWVTARMAALTVAFGAGMVWVVRPVLLRFTARALERGKGELGLNALAAVLVILFLCAVATNLIGIFAIFGAFALGAVLSDQHGFREAVERRLRDFVTCFFLPLYFAYTGLRTRVDALDSWQTWALAAAVCAAAVAGKLVGCAVAARLGGMSRRESACVGVMMNTRGLMELVVINAGKDLGVIPDSVFCMLVLMALVTTFMTTPLLVRAARGTELEGPIRRAGFLGAAHGEPPPGG